MASSGNFCTLNPLTEYNSRMSQGNYSNGNLTYDDVGGDGWICNMAMTHKTYCEYRIDSLGGYGGVQGLRGIQAVSQTYDSVTFQASYSSGQIYHYKGSSDQSYSGNIGGTVSAGNIIMMAYDPATYKWWVGVNGTWRNSGDPANGTGYVFEGSATMFENMNVTWGGWSGDVNRLDHTWNFGQDSTFGGQETAGGNADENGFGDFKYTPPTGFLALCSGNEVISSDIDPAQTDTDFPGKQFNVATWTGNGTNDTAIDLDMAPDLVVIKERGAANNWYWIDSTRGVTNTLQTNSTGSTHTESGVLNAFTSTGFTIGTSGGSNNSSDTYCGWGWRANGGTTSTNSEGDADSTVQANTAAGFSIVQFPNYSGDTKFGHGLTKAPNFIIAKLTASGSNYPTYHDGYSSGKCCFVNKTDAEATSSHFAHSGTGNPVSATTFGLGASFAGSGAGIAWCWHSVDGYSKFGKWEGNANNNGPFIYTGFKPRLVFIKSVDTVAPWVIWDTARTTDRNPANNGLAWNASGAESDYTGYPIDILSNGFKLRSSNATINASGTWIFGAWSDVPFKYNNIF